MTEEIKQETTPATTDAKEVKSHVYYISTNDLPCAPFVTPFEIDRTVFPFVTEAPDPALKSPKFDWAKFQWFENEAQSQGQQIADLKDKIATFTKSVEGVEKSQQASMQQNTLVTKQMAAQQKMLMMMQQTLQNIATSVAKAPTATDEKKDEVENGGNK